MVDEPVEVVELWASAPDFLRPCFGATVETESEKKKKKIRKDKKKRKKKEGDKLKGSE